MKYFQIVEQLAPNEMLQKFATSAPNNVQAAAKSTILSILGSLPNYALDAGESEGCDGCDPVLHRSARERKNAYMGE